MAQTGDGLAGRAGGQRRLGHGLAGHGDLGEGGLHHHLALGRGEAEAGAVGVGEGLQHVVMRGHGDGQEAVGAGVAQVQAVDGDEAGRVGALARQLVAAGMFQRLQAGAQPGHGARRQRALDGRLADDRLVGEAHAVGGEHAGEGVQEHRLHAQLVGHQAGMLPAGAAEAGQRVFGHVVAALERHLLDGVRHVADGDTQEALGHGFRREAAHALRQLRELLAHDGGIERLVAAGAEDGRELCRLDLADHDVGVGHGERAAAAVAGRARHRAGAVRADAGAGAVEVQDGAAAGRHGVDRHHRRAHPHAGHHRLEGALELAVVERHVGRGAAHVEADDPVKARHGGGARGADDPAGRAGEDGVLALEARGLGQPAGGLHEVQAGAGPQFAGDLRHIAAQDGREIGVHHRRVAARHDARQRAGAVRQADLAEALLDGDSAQPLLVRRVGPGVHQHHGDGADAGGVRLAQGGTGRRLVQRFQFRPVHADAAADLGHPLVQQRRQPHVEVEEARPGLVADAQHVAHAAADQQQHALAPAFQQGVGGDGGAHLHRLDGAGRQRRIQGEAEHLADAGHRGIVVPLGILRQQLDGGERAVRGAGDDVGEGAAAIHPELPARHRRLHRWSYFPLSDNLSAFCQRFLALP